jgi:GntR family transcriptional regulator/MocR family aminotransferase
MLKEEGYIESRERSGYFVTEFAPVAKVKKEKWQLELLNVKDTPGEGTGGVDNAHATTEHFPESLYFKTIRGVLSEYGSRLLEKSPNEGCAILRNAIAEYLLRYRGIYAQPKQIIIGSGAEYLYNVVVRMFGTEIIYGLENPSYKQIRKVYEGMGARCEMLHMGREGIQSEELQGTKAKILHVTPFHSYPSGVTASVKKRHEYLEWAKNHDGIIIEDDFDSEFFMPGKPIDTLYMSDTNQSVIYMNTFSKSLSSSIRIGYMILPERLMDLYKESVGDFSCTVPVLDQYVLAEFMNRGHFEQHLNRVRRQKNHEK